MKITIETIKKTYAKVEGGVLIPTEQGFLTNDKLQEYFESFINVKYTANMEKELDDIAASKITKDQALNEFYNDFIKLYDKADDTMEHVKPAPTGKFCPTCGSPLVLRKGKYGEFYGCGNFPNCNYMEKKEIEVPSNAKKCPKCKKKLKLPIPYKKGIKSVICPKCNKKFSMLVLKSEKIEIISKKK